MKRTSLVVSIFFSLFSAGYFIHYFGSDVLKVSDISGVRGFLREDKNEEALKLIDSSLVSHGSDGLKSRVTSHKIVQKY